MKKGMKTKFSKRYSGTWNTDLPLTSKRAKVILSHSSEAKKLLKAIRASRDGESKPFHLTEEVNQMVHDVK
ncbi:MAG: hypothetical protein ACOC2M_02470 [bacterium]